MHMRGAAFRPEGPPKNGNAAPTAIRDGAKSKVQKHDDRYAPQNSPSTGRRTGSTKKVAKRDDVRNVVRLRPRQLRRLYKKRHGTTLPDNEEGRRLAAIMLDHLVHGHDGHHEATVFLIRSCPWMAPAERADAIARAFRDRKFWSASALGDELWLTWEERDDCGITTIRPFWATDEDMAAFRQVKNTASKRKKRQQETKPKKEALPVIRAKAIADLLKLGERCTVKDLCEKRSCIRLGHLDGKALTTAVHNAINCGIELGFFRKDVVAEHAGYLAVAWITKISEGPQKPTRNKTGTDRGHFVPVGDKSLSPSVPQAADMKKVSVLKTCPQQVLIIEEGLQGGLSVDQCPDQGAGVHHSDGGSDQDQTVLGGRVALGAPPALAKTCIGHLSSSDTVFGKEEGNGVICLERVGTNCFVPFVPRVSPSCPR